MRMGKGSFASSIVVNGSGAPKVELHVHLEGSWHGPHLYEMAMRHVDKLPESVDVAGKAVPLQQAIRDADGAQDFLDKHVHLPSTTCTLSAFLAPFNWVMAIVHTAIRSEGLGALEEFALQFAKRQHESNAVYTEVRWCPHLLLEADILNAADTEVRYAAARHVLQAVARGLKRGEAAYGIQLRQILCCVDFMPHVSADIARLLCEVGRACDCVGIDVAAGEGHFNSKRDDNQCLKAVEEARKAGFGSTIHAGEDVNTGGTAANVQRAIEDYGATRIGYAATSARGRGRRRVMAGRPTARADSHHHLLPCPCPCQSMRATLATHVFLLIDADAPPFASSPP